MDEETKHEIEIDRILDFAKEESNTDLYVWIISYLISKWSSKELKEVKRENWIKDKDIWENHQRTKTIYSLELKE